VLRPSQEYAPARNPAARFLVCRQPLPRKNAAPVRNRFPAGAAFFTIQIISVPVAGAPARNIPGWGSWLGQVPGWDMFLAGAQHISSSVTSHPRPADFRKDPSVHAWHVGVGFSATTLPPLQSKNEFVNKYKFRKQTNKTNPRNK
jgi:hypothetical protein